MKKRKSGLAFLGVLALLSPLSLANAPAPTYPEISHDDYAYSCSMDFIGVSNSTNYYAVSVNNDSDYDIQPQGLIARYGNNVATSSYFFDDLFVPRHTKSLPIVLSSYYDLFWQNDKPGDLTLSLTGILSQGEITEAGATSFTSPNPTLTFTHNSAMPYRTQVVTSFVDLSITDKKASYYVRQYTYTDGSSLAFYNYRSSDDTYSSGVSDLYLYDPSGSYQSQDFTYVKTYRIADDPNKTKTVPSTYRGVIGPLIMILLMSLLLGVVIAVSAVVVVAMVKVCRHA